MMWLPPPGTLTILMAVLVGLFYLFERPSRRARVVFVIVLLLLAAGEIYVLTRAQEISDQHFAYIVKRFDYVQSIVLDIQRTQARLAALPPAPYPKSSPLNVKSKTLTLSYDILTFLAEREAGAPFPLVQPYVRGKMWLGPESPENIKYEEQTAMNYSQSFGAQVVAIRDELANLGFRDDELDKLLAKHPAGSFAIRMIAEKAWYVGRAD